MIDDKPRELTKDLIKTLIELGKTGEQAKVTGIMQVVNYTSSDQAKIMLSDGYSFTECSVFKSAWQKLKDVIKQYDVAQVNILHHKGKLFVALDIHIIYTDVGQQIGNPIPLNSYIEKGGANTSGDSRIPAKFWEKKMASTSSQQFKEELDDLDDGATPINLLTQTSTSWMLKARVLQKSEIKKFGGGNSTKRAGSLFNIVIADKTSKIQATFFNDAVDKWYSILEVGKVYLFSGGEVKKKSQYNSTTIDIELSFSCRSEITLVKNDESLPKQFFQFAKISEVEKRDVNTHIDVAGVITSIELPKEFISKADDSEVTVEVTIWGDHCQLTQNLKVGDALIITNAKIGQYQGKTLGTTFDSQILTTMIDHPRVKSLIVWRNQAEKTGKLSNPDQFTSLKIDKEAKRSNDLVLTIEQYKRYVEDLDSNSTEKQPTVQIVGWVASLPGGFDRSNYYYDKCPNDKCYKKCRPDESNPNSYFCDNCGPLDKPPIPKYIGNFRISDSSGSIYCKIAADYVGTALFGISAQELREKEVAVEKEEFLAFLRTRTHIEYQFSLIPKWENYQGESKIAHSALGVIPLSVRSAPVRSKIMLSTINELQMIIEGIKKP